MKMKKKMKRLKEKAIFLPSKEDNKESVRMKR